VKVVLLYVLPLVLMLYALIDCVQDDDAERTGLPKALWIVLIILIVYFGPIAWLVVTKIAKPKSHDRPSSPRSSPPVFPRGAARRSGPTAPDDDPDFLRRLDEQARRNRRQNRNTGEADPSSSPAPES
jgi:hypothetical protein